jgi:hypothetical protein
MAVLKSNQNGAELHLSVLLPVRNSAALLPDHLHSMETWIDLAREIVVVDSDSADGSVELIRSRIRHPQLRILKHPPGLYQSWNFGIQNLSGKYTYISTVGDSITREGLHHLGSVAEEGRCDVVISKPAFIDAQGRPRRPDHWPIDDLLGTLQITRPAVMESELLFLFVLVNCTEAILGSSASNVYRTELLQAHPFPVDYGTVGDGAWGHQHALHVRLGVTPEIFSTFRHHPKSYAPSEYAVAELPEKLFQLCRQTFERSHLPYKGRIDWQPIVQAVEKRHEWQRELVRCRQMRLPWALNPLAWHARMRREQFMARIQRLKAAAIRQLAAEPALTPAPQAHGAGA